MSIDRLVRKLSIIKAAHGGYLVHESPMDGMYTELMFCSTTIDEALKFIRNTLTPGENK